MPRAFALRPLRSCTGTLTHCSVYPREIVKIRSVPQCGQVHPVSQSPCGEKDPSEADRKLARLIQQALSLVEMRVLDHIIVAGAETYSFAENGDL